jgi:hypothetical protein
MTGRHANIAHVRRSRGVSISSMSRDRLGIRPSNVVLADYSEIGFMSINRI